MHPKAQLHVDSVSGHAPSNAIVVQDAHLLFTGDYKRAGVDLVISKDGHELVVPDYFRGEKRAALASSDGAHLSGDVVNALAGHTQFAQADGSASVAKVIGHVTKLVGNATVMRNGVAIVLNLGDNVHQGDVVQSGSNSTLGITFIDGSVFGLGSNAKMVLNEMIYDPNGSGNSSLLSLVQGTISFVAGATAKHGDMKVDTPVATMGIRGTAVLVEIDFEVPGSGSVPPARFQVLVEPDGTTGNYVLLDKITLLPIATVNQAGMQTTVNSQGGVSVGSAQLSQEAQDIIRQVFSLKFANADPFTNTHFTNTLIPETKFIQLASGQEVPVTIVTINLSDTTAPTTTSGPASSRDHIPGPPTAATTNATLSERGGATGSSQVDKTIGSVTYEDINAGDVPTVKATFTSFKYQDAGQHDVTATLTASQRAAIQAVEVALVVEQDPNQKNFGTATWTYNIADHALDFLAAGEILTLTYTAEVNNNFAPNPEKTFQTFTITITGTNDLPVIETGPQSIAFAAGRTTPGGVLQPTNGQTIGTLAFTDTDLTDIHTVSTRLVSADLPGATVPPTPLGLFQAALSAQIAADSTLSGTGTIDWQFADLPVWVADFIPEDETLTLTYEVTVKDSQGTTSTQIVIVTITGTDAPAVVWIATTSGQPSGGLWSQALNWETGTVPTANDDVIIITDQLHGLTPSYPVTVDAQTHAVAKTLTMNDFSPAGAAAPKLVNLGELTVSGQFDLINDAIVENSGTIIVGGPMEILGASVLTNSGTLNLGQGGDFKDTSSISNLGTGVIDVQGGTLNDFVAIVNGGMITIGSGARLVMNGGSITGGVLDNSGTIETASGTDTISGATSFTNSGTLDVLNSSTLVLASETLINTGTVNVVGSGATLDLQGATISGGALNNSGTVASTGSNFLTNVDLTNTGTVEIASGSLTVTGSISGDGSIQIDEGAQLELGATVSTAQRIVFDGDGSSELVIDASSLAGSVLGGRIVDLGATDRLDLTTIAYDLNTTAVYSAITGVLTVTDGYGHSVSMTLVGDYTNAHFAGSDDGAGHTLITLNAVDDAPVIAAGDKTGSASVAELAATTGATTTDLSNPIGGTIHFTDIDLTDRPTATITAQTVTWTGGALTSSQVDALAQGLLLASATNTNNGAVTWTYSIADNALDFLGQGQTATVKSTITLDDHQDGSDTATVTITVIGANDLPVVDAVQAGTLVDTSAHDTFANLTGQLAGHDADQGETASLVYAALDAAGHAVNTAIAGHYGSLTVNADGAYSYAADAAAINALPVGSFSDTFTVQTKDVHGAIGTALLTVNVIGANDEGIGEVGSNAVIGTSGDDVLFAGSNNVLFGGGGNDTFVFNATMDHATISDFTTGQDHIQLNPTPFDDQASFQDWAASHVAPQGLDTLITFDATNTILLKNVASLQASDFILNV